MFLGVIYENTNLPKKGFKILWSKGEISCLQDESEDIFKKYARYVYGQTWQVFS